MPVRSRLARLWEYLWRLDRETKQLLRMEPVALLEQSPGMDERERELTKRLLGDGGRSHDDGDETTTDGTDVGSRGGAGTDGDPAGGSGADSAAGGAPDGEDPDGEDQSGGGEDDPEDEADFDAGFARSEEGSTFDTGGAYGLRQKVGLLLGPLLFAAILLAPNPEGLTWAGQATGATTAWVAVWWISEAIPIPATSLLPIVLLPVWAG